MSHSYVVVFAHWTVQYEKLNGVVFSVLSVPSEKRNLHWYGPDSGTQLLPEPCQ